MRPVRAVFLALSCIALAATAAPAFLYFAGSMDAVSMKAWMLAATVAWFAVTPFWMER